MSIEDEVNEAAGLPDIPELPGWKSLPAVGNKLHVSRQRIFQMALIERRFKTLHLIPGAHYFEDSEASRTQMVDRGRAAADGVRRRRGRNERVPRGAEGGDGR